jgi:hypothetical protein
MVHTASDSMVFQPPDILCVTRRCLVCVMCCHSLTPPCFVERTPGCERSVHIRNVPMFGNTPHVHLHQLKERDPMRRSFLTFRYQGHRWGSMHRYASLPVSKSWQRFPKTTPRQLLLRYTTSSHTYSHVRRLLHETELDPNN